jgi:hypothetical protein
MHTPLEQVCPAGQQAPLQHEPSPALWQQTPSHNGSAQTQLPSEQVWPPGQQTPSQGGASDPWQTQTSL